MVPYTAAAKLGKENCPECEDHGLVEDTDGVLWPCPRCELGRVLENDIEAWERALSGK